jgi:hypothetical protein
MDQAVSYHYVARSPPARGSNLADNASLTGNGATPGGDLDALRGMLAANSGLAAARIGDTARRARSCTSSDVVEVE